MSKDEAFALLREALYSEQGKVYVYQDILQKLEIDEEEGKEQ